MEAVLEKPKHSVENPLGLSVDEMSEHDHRPHPHGLTRGEGSRLSAVMADAKKNAKSVAGEKEVEWVCAADNTKNAKDILRDPAAVYYFFGFERVGPNSTKEVRAVQFKSSGKFEAFWIPVSTRWDSNARCVFGPPKSESR